MSIEKRRPSSKPKKGPGRKIQLPEKINNIDENVRKKIIEDKKDEMVVSAEKIAREMVARMELEVSSPLNEIQREAALLYASGFSIDEISSRLNIMNVTFEQWLKIPAFSKQINEYIYSNGLVDKTERIRLAQRRLKALNDAFFDKIEDVNQLSITTLSKMIIEHNKEIADLVDNKVDNTKKDISILIVNHYKNQGKQYSDIDDLLNDPEFNFPIIDADFKDG